ncbi:DUF2079 domain-containing protein [Peterkaempfera bronchialis]|uniref:DUF2079 domain-containing protein n=1 Tax=Peterkaempfera bronchialis TaxID=2126346 RepID=A0A345T2Z4_9ACTN|nr:DUF2079 domain-containing protein [Peterkaempfera bronchialis]AXI80349.1 DUF2079 domain-containing protein [Peterkaempfera bronchialis]
MTAVVPALRRLLPSRSRPAVPDGDDTARQGPARWAWWPHAALGAGFMAVFCVIALARYQRFDDQSWDLGIFVQVARGWAARQIPVVTIKGDGYAILGDHWSPILAVLGPLWRVWPSPVMLLVLQAGLFSWSIGIVSETAARLLGLTRGLLVGGAFGLSWGLQRAVDFQFHEIAFGVPLIAVVARQLLLRNWEEAAWWCLPLLLVKEDMGLTVAAVGAVLLINRRWRLGPLLVVLGLAWSACALWWWIPHFNTAGSFDYWTKLPGTGGQSLDWWDLARSMVTRHTVWTTVGWLVGATAFLCLRSPLTILVLPTLAWRFASDNATYWGRDWHYSAVLMPVLFLAAVDGLNRCDLSPRRWMRSWARNGVTAMVAIAATCTVAAPLPLSDLVEPATYQGGEQAAELRAAVRVIPDGATVEAANRPLAHLAARCRVYWPGGSVAVPPQYILIESDDLALDGPAYGRAYHPQATYQTVFHQGRVTVVQRIG